MTRPTSRRRWAALVVPLLLLPGLAACSSDDADEDASSGSGTPPEPGAGADDSPAAAERFAALPASSIEAAVLQDMSEVTTVRARVRATHLGLPVDAQVAVGEEGACLGTLTAGSGTAEVLRPTRMVSGIGDSEDVYGAFDAPFLEEVGFTAEQADAVVAAAAGRWVLLDPLSGLTDIALVCQALDDTRDGRLLGGEDATTEVTGLEQVDDQPVLGLERTGEEGPVSLVVAATGEHRFVRVVTPRDGSPATVDELAYDEEVVVPDPAARGVVPAAEVGLD
ncbi:hypothetical protein [Nocardioides zeae]|nr:hypothetical protein [Nocardioides zeae]